MFSKKSKVFKKAVTLGMCALMAVSSFGMSAAAAGNYGDTGFKNFSISSSSKYTSPRQKLDTTSASIKVTSAKYKMIVRVYGTNSSSTSLFRRS